MIETRENYIESHFEQYESPLQDRIIQNMNKMNDVYTQINQSVKQNIIIYVLIWITIIVIIIFCLSAITKLQVRHIKNLIGPLIILCIVGLMNQYIS